MFVDYLAHRSLVRFDKETRRKKGLFTDLTKRHVCHYDSQNTRLLSLKQTLGASQQLHTIPILLLVIVEVKKVLGCSLVHFLYICLSGALHAEFRADSSKTFDL